MRAGEAENRQSKEGVCWDGTFVLRDLDPQMTAG